METGEIKTDDIRTDDITKDDIRTDEIKPDKMKRKESKKKAHKDQTARERSVHGWLIMGICVSLALSVLFTSLYGVFRRKAKQDTYNPLESEESISWIYRNSYLLYRDLYNKVNHTNISFSNLYLPAAEGYESMSDRQIGEDASAAGANTDAAADSSDEDEFSQEDFEEDIADWIQRMNLYLNDYFEELNGDFSRLNSLFDYQIRDLDSGTYISNLLDPNIRLADQFFYIRFLFDKEGNVTVENDVRGADTTSIRKNANAAIRNFSLYDMAQEWQRQTEAARGQELPAYYAVNVPKNCTVTYCISNASWEKMQKEGVYYITDDTGYTEYYKYSDYFSFLNSGVGAILFLMIACVFLLALFLPGAGYGEPWKRYKLFSMPIEAALILLSIWIAVAELVITLAYQVSSGNLTSSIDSLLGAGIPFSFAGLLAYLFNLLAVAAFFLGGWLFGICFRRARAMGIKEYIRQKSILYRIFPFVKKKLTEIYDAVSHFDVTKKANKLIIKIVLLNALILFIISSLWMGGLAVAVIYSVLLYFVLKKYISDLQKKYGILLGAINRIAEGDLNTVIVEDIGVFEPFKPQIIRIQNGFRKAVDDEVKSQSMKAELITNVSHDLKTPLTAIITYVNLLQEENLTEEQRKEYLNTLERKSLRLKVLIEDLFEVSKANSGNITLTIMDVDVISLIKQVELEMSDKLKASGLEVRMNLPEQKVILPLDSQKTYRIYENLFGNIAKYALPGTRVYVDALIGENELVITLKNVTAEEISVDAADLTDRFVRGDASRNTEGSGLGLAIAKSFTELQNGSLTITVDGDLFKVSTVWKYPQ